jgi:hypothetical protein
MVFIGKDGKIVKDPKDAARFERIEYDDDGDVIIRSVGTISE